MKSKRLFRFTFFDEVAASRFFETFTEELPDGAKKGLSYWEFRNGGSDSEDEESSKEENVDKTLVDENDLDGEDDDCQRWSGNGGGDEASNGGDGDKTADDDEIDELKRIMELEENWGESQSLFNPLAPEDV